MNCTEAELESSQISRFGNYRSKTKILKSVLVVVAVILVVAFLGSVSDLKPNVAGRIETLRIAKKVEGESPTTLDVKANVDCVALANAAGFTGLMGSMSLQPGSSLVKSAPGCDVWAEHAGRCLEGFKYAPGAFYAHCMDYSDQTCKQRGYCATPTPWNSYFMSKTDPSCFLQQFKGGCPLDCVALANQAGFTGLYGGLAYQTGSSVITQESGACGVWVGTAGRCLDGYKAGAQYAQCMQYSSATCEQRGFNKGGTPWNSLWWTRTNPKCFLMYWSKYASCV